MAEPRTRSLILRKGELIVPLHRVTLCPLENRIMWALIAQYGRRATSIMELIDICYGDREDGGPLCANGVVRRMVFELRKKLRPIGWRIVTRWCGYELRRI